MDTNDTNIICEKKFKYTDTKIPTIPLNQFNRTVLINIIETWFSKPLESKLKNKLKDDMLSLAKINTLCDKSSTIEELFSHI